LGKGGKDERLKEAGKKEGSDRAYKDDNALVDGKELREGRNWNKGRRKWDAREPC